MSAAQSLGGLPCVGSVDITAPASQMPDEASSRVEQGHSGGESPPPLGYPHHLWKSDVARSDEADHPDAMATTSSEPVQLRDTFADVLAEIAERENEGDD